MKRDLWAKAKEYSGVAVFLSVVLVVTLLIVRDNANSTAVEQRQRVIITALAAENNEAIKANSDFQSCVWLSIVKPNVVGHEDRSVWAIKACERKYLK